jgi:cysteine sulfinate desulfinase/cysteine desulfurase-like protein
MARVLSDRVSFNGAFGQSLYAVLNVSFPKTEIEIILFNLDINGICASRQCMQVVWI